MGVDKFGEGIEWVIAFWVWVWVSAVFPIPSPTATRIKTKYNQRAEEFPCARQLGVTRHADDSAQVY